MIVGDNKIESQNNATASGIIEIREEREVLLDDIVLSKNEWSEKRCSEREERSGQDRRLALAGEEIKIWVGRQASPESEAEKGSRTEEQVSTPGFSTRRRGRKRLLSFDSAEEEK